MELDTVLKTAFIFAVVIGAFVPVITWIERKQSAVMQDRIGANRADIGGITILGLLHPLADVLKLLAKEDVVPQGANRFLHLLAPVIAVIPAIIAFAVIPYGGVYDFGGPKPLALVVADIDWGILYIFAIGSLAAYGTVIAGWASNNNWSMLGSLRASAQVISYEVTMGLSVVGVLMVFGTLSLLQMGLAQDATFRLFGFFELFGLVDDIGWLGALSLPKWGVFLQPLGFIMFLSCAMAENKRAPFDIPEAEQELVAGYHLEYSGMRFGLFYTSEFIEVVVIAGLMTALFLGGWTIPWLPQATIIGAITPAFGDGFATVLCMVLHVVSFFAKVVVMIFLQMSLRWSLARFRYDQVMDLCWKIFLPLSLANIVVTGGVLLLIEALA